MSRISRKEQYIRKNKIKVSSNKEIARYIVVGLLFILLYALVKGNVIALPNDSDGAASLMSLVFGIGMLLVGIIELLFTKSVKLIKQTRR